jgi:hypothetical protein
MTSIESNTINSSSSADFWKNHIAHWQSSGLKLASYCRQQQLSYHKFKYWKYKLSAINSIVPSETNVGFTRVQIAETTKSSSPSSLCIPFSDGTQVIGVTLDTIPLARQLVEVLR